MVFTEGGVIVDVIDDTVVKYCVVSLIGGSVDGPVEGAVGFGGGIVTPSGSRRSWACSLSTPGAPSTTTHMKSDTAFMVSASCLQIRVLLTFLI